MDCPQDQDSSFQTMNNTDFASCPQKGVGNTRNNQPN